MAATSWAVVSSGRRLTISRAIEPARRSSPSSRITFASRSCGHSLTTVAAERLCVGVHPHVERRVVGVGEAALPGVDLHRGHAEVEDDSVRPHALVHAGPRAPRRSRRAESASAREPRRRRRVQRSSAAGSRSTAISSPSAPMRSAIRRAWPPPPKVQSTKVSPGLRVEDVDELGCEYGLVFGGHIGKVRGCGQLSGRGVCGGRIQGAPLPGVSQWPFLSLLARPRRGSPLRRRPLRPFPSRRRPSARRSRSRTSRPTPTITHGPSPSPACSTSFLGRRMRPAESSDSSKAPPWKWRRSMRPRLPSGLVSAQELLREVLVAVGREHPDGGVEPFGENDSISERRAEPRGDREAVLRIEIVLVLTEKRQSGVPLGESSERAGEVRWEEPHHPGPVDQLCFATLTHSVPLCNTDWARALHRIRRTELLPGWPTR